MPVVMFLINILLLRSTKPHFGALFLGVLHSHVSLRQNPSYLGGVVGLVIRQLSTDPG